MERYKKKVPLSSLNPAPHTGFPQRKSFEGMIWSEGKSQKISSTPSFFLITLDSAEYHFFWGWNKDLSSFLQWIHGHSDLFFSEQNNCQTDERFFTIIIIISLELPSGAIFLTIFVAPPENLPERCREFWYSVLRKRIAQSPPSKGDW